MRGTYAKGEPKNSKLCVRQRYVSFAPNPQKRCLFEIGDEAIAKEQPKKIQTTKKHFGTIPFRVVEVLVSNN